MRPLTPFNRRLLHGAQYLTGAAVVFALLGKARPSIVAAGLAAALALTILRNLIRNGDR